MSLKYVQILSVGSGSLIICSEGMSGPPSRYSCKESIDWRLPTGRGDLDEIHLFRRGVVDDFQETDDIWVAEIFHNRDLSLDLVGDVHVPLVGRPNSRKAEEGQRIEKGMRGREGRDLEIIFMA
jgi:hypothetical protein